MKIALVGGPFAPGPARAAAVAALAAPAVGTPASGAGGVVVLGPGPLPPAPEPGDSGGEAAIACITVAGSPWPGGGYDYAPAVAELTRLLAGKPRALALETLALPAILGDPHGERAPELVGALARVLYWDRDRPGVVVHFCQPNSLPHYLRAWSHYVLSAPDQGIVEAADLGADLAGRRLAHHAAYAEERRRANSFRTRLWGAAVKRLGRLLGRLRFWGR